jgi:MinD-like ATPase involved in chromosome partitioning or flagellar assembly
VSGDNGRPIVVERPESQAARALAEIAKRVAARMSVISLAQGDAIPLQVIG